jgi:hypothetical protein
MNETSDPLEAELLALSPHDISSGLRRRIAERLAEPSSAIRPRPRWWRAALTGAIAAACLIAVVSWWGKEGVNSQHVIVGSQNVPPVEPAPRVKQVTPVSTAGWEPRLLTYQRALVRSPEELEFLLNREATFATESQAQLVQFHAFTPSNASLNALLGDD